MSCCAKCKKIIVYTIDDIINSQYFNFCGIPQAVSINYDCAKFISFVSIELKQEIFEYITMKWCIFLSTLKDFFAGEYQTYDLKKLQERVYQLFYNLWSEQFLSVLLYIKSINPELFSDNTSDITIVSTNIEPLRDEINNEFDFQKDNIKNQIATANKNNKQNLGDVILKLQSQESIMNQIFYSARQIIDHLIIKIIPNNIIGVK